MSSLLIGTIHNMKVKNETDEGYIVAKGTDQALLPYDQSKEKLTPDEQVDVFLYEDKQGKLTASTKLPKVVKGVYDWADVVQLIPKLGVFVDIGTDVEVLVSLDELPPFTPVWPDKGDKLYVTLTVDKKNRLLAVPATERYFADLFGFAEDLELNQEVSGHVIRVDREGSVIITDDNYRAFIHHTERDKEPRLGQYVTGRIIEVKEDGTLNVSLLPLKHERLETDAEKIFAYLEASNGEMPFDDKSDPEEIRGTFRMSKGAFKRALGRLMKEGKVEQRDGKTYMK